MNLKKLLNKIKNQKDNSKPENNEIFHKTTLPPTTTTTTTTKQDKILFILKTNYYSQGYSQSYGLGNASKMIAEYLESQGLECKVVYVTDDDDIDAEVDSFNPSKVIIEALWLLPKKLDELSDKYKNIEWIVRIHSNVGFLAVEPKAFSKIKNYLLLEKNNVKLSSNNYEFNEELSIVCREDFKYLPNIIKLSNTVIWDMCDHYNQGHKPNDIINIGCFGALRVLKNQLFQAMCAIEAADRLVRVLHFHVNKDSELLESPVLQNLENLFKINNKHKLIVHEWLEHDDFIDLINTMDIGLQVSFTESFNLVTADFVNDGIPTIVSETISWMPDNVQVSTVDFDSLIRKIVHVYNSDNKHQIKLNKLALIKYNQESKRVWDKFVD